jgi:fatty acid desaturase
MINCCQSTALLKTSIASLAVVLLLLLLLWPSILLPPFLLLFNVGINLFRRQTLQPSPNSSWVNTCWPQRQLHPMDCNEQLAIILC